MIRLKSKIDWFILLLIIFTPRLFNLDLFLTADEPLFLQHSREFAAGLASGDFSQTLGIGYPGVTLAAWVAPLINLAHSELGAYTIGRLATGVLGALLLLLLYALARLLLGRWPAFWGVGLLALDPYTLAYSRLLHIAAPLALFMTLVGLSFLLRLQENRRRWLLLSGLFTGLALLTKSTALLLGPMLGAMLLGWGWSSGQWRNKTWCFNKIGDLFSISLLAGIVFFALWPAAWVDPLGTVSLTFGKLLTDQEAGSGNLGLFWWGRFVEDPGPAFYAVAFILKATPWLLLGLFLSLFYILSTLRQSSHPTSASSISPSPHPLLTLPLWLFALTYLILMTIASKKSIRYMLPAFPTFYLLAGVAYCQLWNQLQKYKRPQYLPFPPAPWLPFILGLGLILFTLLYHPYYFTYYNPLVLGWRWAPQTLLLGWGEGLDEAARYLNDQQEQRVAVWYEWLFPIFYKGEVQAVVPQENLITADYAVLYINQVQRDIPGPNIINYFRRRRQAEHTVRLNGIDYAWVYPGPIAGFRAAPLPQFSLGGEFGGEARLLGYDLQPQPVSGDQSLIVTLYWQALISPPSDRFVYLRLVDDKGHIWARADSPPVMGLWPSTKWLPDMLIEDAHELPIPPGTPPGIYRLEVGLYDPERGQTLTAEGQQLGQGGGLLLGEVELLWQAVGSDPELPGQTNTALAPDVDLLGYIGPPSTATSGDIFTIQLAWRETSTMMSRLLELPHDWVMFEWHQNGQAVAEQLDPLPLPLEQWGRGATLLSQHDVIVPPVLSSGDYDLVILLHNGSYHDGSNPAGDTFLLGSVDVTAPPHNFDLPAEVIKPASSTELKAEAGQSITLVAYQVDTSPQEMTVNLYWQTDAPLSTPYKVFLQLLTADNLVVVQSDLVPAIGQRPTTGWLPNEIISDTHSLSLPADLPLGDYHLIAGLYNPLNGQRLTRHNQAGEVSGDALTLTEVSLP